MEGSFKSFAKNISNFFQDLFAKDKKDIEKNPDIIVFGSARMSLTCHVDQFSRNGQGQAIQSFHKVLGGKAVDMAIIAAQINPDTRLYSAVGSDPYGKKILSGLQEHGLVTENIKIIEGKESGFSHVFCDPKGHTETYVDRGVSDYVANNLVSNNALKEAKIVLLDMSANQHEAANLAHRAKAFGCETVVNFSPVGDQPALDILDHTDLLVVNEVDAAQIANHLSINLKNFETAPKDNKNYYLASKIEEKTGTDCIITAGGTGTFVKLKDQKVQRFQAENGHIVNTCSPVNTLCGAFAAARTALGMNRDLAIEFASAAAAQSCSIQNGKYLSKEQLLQLAP